MAPYLAVEDLHVAFGELSVLAGLSFDIHEGEVYCLLGPNGAGKSTCINVVCDLLRPQKGTVTIGGETNTKAPRDRLGVAPQEVAVYADLTCSQNLEFFAAVYGLDSRTRRTRSAEYLDAVGLTDRADSLVSELSGGMRRRLHLASSLLHDPPLLILDEPTVGLDLEVRLRIWNLITQLKRAGRAILLTSHHLEEAEKLGTRIGVIHQGTIVAEGTMDELRTWIPAAELAVVESLEPESIGQRARELGLTFRRSYDTIVIWLEEKTDIRSVVDALGEVPMTSVRLKPVGLEDVFAEIVGDDVVDAVALRD